MATKIIDKNIVKALTTKNYYSWILNGENSVDYVVSDSLSSLALDTGVPEVGSEVQDIKFTGGTDNAKVSTIANGFSYAGAASTTYLAQKSLSVINVDAKTIYGGAVIMSKAGKYTSPATKRTDTVVTVDGSANLYINNVKATSVYGGGAGYGSVLTKDVNITVDGTNKITNIYGGGQKGAVVEGDVNIVINRTGLGEAGKISNIYGGGDNATVLGDVNITINGVNSNKIGTVSGNGKGSKAILGADTVRTLYIADYAGDFTATIKEFDKVVFEAGTAVTLTKAQQNSMKSAEYEFIVDWDSTKNPTEAMLTWNKKVNASALYVTIDAEFANEVDTAFQKTIFTSNQITADFLDQMRVRDAAGKDITSGYTLEFVAAEKNGKVQKKGGSIVLNYVGSKSEIGIDSGDTELTDAGDKVQIKGDLVRASLDTKGGDDIVTVQTGTLMAGDIYLGEGENTLNVQGGAEVTGSVNVEKNSTNIINVNGTISQIAGGDSTTNNIVTLRSPNAVGYYDYEIIPNASGSLDGYHDITEGTGGCSSCSSITQDASGKVGISFDTGLTYRKVDRDGDGVYDFIPQDLDFTASEGSNDRVLVTTAGTYEGNINFGKGSDTLILNTTVAGTITADDGDDMIVANKTGVEINAATLKLSGTDNVFVASNGVYATINNAGAIGNFEGQFAGLYLSQNAMIDVNNTLATMSFAGNIDLAALGKRTLRNGDVVGVPKDLVILPVAQQLDRVSEFYTQGDGVQGDINAAGNNITFREGAKMVGTIWQKADAGAESTVRFMGSNTADSRISFNNDGWTTLLQVDKNTLATVASIDGLSGHTYDAWMDTFDLDLAQVAWGGKDAAVYEFDTKNLIVGFITQDVTDFAEAFGVDEVKQITIDGILSGDVTFTNDTVYTAVDYAGLVGLNGIGFNGDVNFVGDNTVNVKTNGLVLDDGQMKFAGDGDKATFNVLREGVLVFDGIEKGADYNKDHITVNYEQNARFAYGDTMETKSWDRAFTADDLNTHAANLNITTIDGIRDNVKFADGAKIEGGIFLDRDYNGKEVGIQGVNVEIGDNAVVKGHLVWEDAGAIVLGKGADTLTIGKSTVDGEIDASNDFSKDVITLNGTTVNAMKAPVIEDAISLYQAQDGGDELFANEATITGNVTGGNLVHLIDSTVAGTIGATENLLVGSNVGSVIAGDTFVESGKDASGTESKIGAIDASLASVNLYADDAKATIGTIGGADDQKIHLEARNGGTVAFEGIDAKVGTVEFLAYHDGSAVDFGGDVKLVAKNAEFKAEEGGALQNLGNVTVSGAANPEIKDLTDVIAAAESAAIISDNGADIKAGDVKFIATNSEIRIASEGTTNEFGAITQSGAVTKNGYVRLPAEAYADKATVAVTKEADFSADSIEQYAKESTVAVVGAADIKGDLTQEGTEFAKAGFVGTANVGGDIDQTANATGVFVSGTADIKGDITQTAAQDAGVQVGYEDGDGNVVAGSATVAGGIVQEAANANATVKVYGTADIADGILQEAATATVNVNGTLKGDINQNDVNAAGEIVEATSATINAAGTIDGDVDQLAADSKVKFDKEAATGSVGAVTQSGSNSAKVIAKAEVDHSYANNPMPFSEELEDKDDVAKFERTLGTVVQTAAAENKVIFGAEVSADGSYGAGQADNHKRAVVTIKDGVTLSAESIDQTGDRNVVVAKVDYTAKGESNVTIGDTALNLGEISQLSGKEVWGGGDLNKVVIGATQTMVVDAQSGTVQSEMTLGDIKGTVGAISQTAYKASNEIDIDMQKTVDEHLTVGDVSMDVEGDITMLAYGRGATNTLDLAGYVNVAGNVNVGGVVTPAAAEGEDAEFSEDTWGDRTAQINTVNVTADTVTIDGDLTLIGVFNSLTATNDSYFKGDAEKKQVAKNVTVAGKSNWIDIDAGVTIDNISLYDLNDHDKIGNQIAGEGEGYELEGWYPNHTNTIILRGEAKSLELNKQKNSDDTIFVAGGKIGGDVETTNGDDVIALGGTLRMIEGLDGVAVPRVMGNATIGGNVTMGIKDAAEGSNWVVMTAFAARDVENPDAPVLHESKIGGDVKMFADSTSNALGIDNLLVMTGLTNVSEHVENPDAAYATIDGAVTMDAKIDYENSDAINGLNVLAMGEFTKIGGGVKMTAKDYNVIGTIASEELVYGDKNFEGYAEIKGAVDMTAGHNAIAVGGMNELLNLIPNVDNYPHGAAAYMDGITMSNTYVAEDGQTYLIENSVNAIVVGDKGLLSPNQEFVGSELIVGKAAGGVDMERAVSDVTMGSLATVKDDIQTTWTIDSVKKAAKGHDVITYLGEQNQLVDGLTDSNLIDVTGRFDAANVDMWAKENTINVQGDGELSKFDTSMDTNEKKAKVHEDVRTASFTVADIEQHAGLYAEGAPATANTITALGTGHVAQYGKAVDADGNETDEVIEIAKLPSVRFDSGAITQEQIGEKAINNTVSLTGSIIANTGDITQTAGGDNSVTVEAYEEIAERSTVGKIDQNAGNDNTVKLTRTEAGMIDQIASNDNTVTLIDAESGAIDQYALKGDNLVDIDPSTVNGTIKQVADEGSNKVTADGKLTANVKDGELIADKPIVEKSYIKGAIDQTAARKNDVIANLTDIEGAITQDGLSINNVDVKGAVTDVGFAHDDADLPLGNYKEQVAVKVGGDITQKNAAINKISLEEVEFGKNVSQTAKFSNTFAAKATETDSAFNTDVSPDEVNCEYTDDHGVKTHASSSVEVAAKWNTQTVGTVTQTAEITAEDKQLFGAKYENKVSADNVNLGDVTQTNKFATNKIEINKIFDGKVTDYATFVGEIDNSLKDVVHVADFERNTTTDVGVIKQTGTANAIDMKGVKGKAVTQTAVAPEVIEGVAGGNKLTVTADLNFDVNAKVIETAVWDPAKEGFDKEVFTKDILKGSANVRAGNTLETIIQTTAATGNYEGPKQVKNEINLANTTVNGDVSQTAVNKNANLKNEFTAATTAQSFVDVGTDANGAKVRVDYFRTTLDNITGSLTQTGFENEASVTNVNVKGNVTQTTELIDTTGHHGDQFVGTDIGGNTLTIRGSKDAEVVETNLVAAGVEKLDAKLNIVDVAVGGKIVQTVNNKDGVTVNAADDDFVDELTEDNVIDASLANTGDVEQTTTYGSNAITAGESSLGKVTQTTTYGNNAIKADQSNLGNVDQNAVDGNNAIYLRNAADEVKTVGTINQDGLQNTVKTGAETGAAIANVKTGAIEQNANGIAGKEADKNVAVVELTNDVTLMGEITPAKAELIDSEADKKKPESWKLTQATRYETAAESIKQVAKVVAEQDDMFNEQMNATNTVTLTLASVGAVEQEGNANTTNTITFTGGEFQKEVALKLDELGDVALDANDKPVLVNEETEIPYSIGKVTQSGVSNTATVITAASAGDVKQDAVSNKTIATTDVTDTTKTVTESMSDISNTLTLDTVATAGKIEQTATSDKFDKIDTKYVKEGDAWKPVEGTEANPNPKVTPDAVTAGNTATLTKANTGDVTQTIKGTAGVGSNTITASESNLGNVKQETTEGENKLIATTATPTDGAKAGDVASKAIGTIDQDGTSNTFEAGKWANEDGSLNTAGDVTTKAITQDANGVAAADQGLANTVKMQGVLVKAGDATPVAGAEDLSKVESWEIVDNATVASAKAESITQNINVKELDGYAGRFEAPAKDDAGNKYFTNSVTLTAADVEGAVIQKGNANIRNELNFTGAEVTPKVVIDTKKTTPDKKYHDEWDYQPVLGNGDVGYPNSIGSVEQEGVENSADIKQGTVDATIKQTAKATQMIEVNDDLKRKDVFGDMTKDEVIEKYGENAGKFFTDNPKVKDNPFKEVKTTRTKVIKNELTLEKVDVLGTIEQTTESGEFLESAEYAWWHNNEDTGSWRPQDGSNGTPDLTKTDIKAYTDGSNTLTIEEGTNVAGKITQTAAGKAADATFNNTLTAQGAVLESEVAEKKVGYASQAEAEAAFTNGSFLNSIGDVEQVLASFADAPADKEAALPTNTITLTDINAGTLTQKATGYAKNVITTPDAGVGNGNVITPLYRATPKTEGEGEAAVTTWNIEAITGATLNPTIKAISQTGYTNEIDLADVKIGTVQEDGTFTAGNISVMATGVEFEDEKGDKDWAFGSNTVTLDDVIAKDITVDTNTGKVTKAGKPLVTVAADATVSLTDTEAVNITIGDGSDQLDLYGSTTITGTIDMGDAVENGKDTLTIYGNDVDLTAATIIDAEEVVFNALEKDGNRLVVDTITTDKISFTNYATDSEWRNNIYAKSITLGEIDQVHYIKSVDGDTKISVTLNDGLNGNLMGSTVKLADDKLAEGDTLALNGGKLNANVYGFETVTIAQAEGLDDIDLSDAKWYQNRLNDGEKAVDTTVANSIKFTFEFNDDNKFVIGDFSDYSGDGYGDVKLNDFVYNGVAGAWTAEADKTKAKADLSDYYTYDKDSRTVSHTVIA